MTAWHILPTIDAIPHELSAECPCGPAVASVPSGFSHTHHQLDPSMETQWVVANEEQHAVRWRRSTSHETEHGGREHGQ